MHQMKIDNQYPILNNRYQIIKELGHGGFGTTYLAKDKQADDSLCAVKRLNSERADIAIAKKLFEREANMLSQLQQVPQIPEFIDYFEEDNCNYIVEEYIEGSSVETLISHHWNETNMAIFLWDILSILQLLHQKNIVHRDIKPSNLIQRKIDNKFTIIDFGAVKEINPKQQKPETCIFSMDYSPPEQVHGMPRLNSDIYALGMTAIELLTKQLPRDIVRDEAGRAISPESELAPLWLINILNKMVQTNIKKRYQSVEEVLKDLGQRDSLPTTPNKPPSPNNFKLWCVPLIVLPLLIIASEVINPWLRPKYYVSQGNNLLDDRQAQASLDKFQQAIAKDRNSAAAWQGRGNALFTLGRYSGALEAYNKTIAIEPKNIKALNNKGKVLSQQGKPQEAIDIYDKAIAIDAQNAEAWSGKGLAYMNMGQPEEALTSFESAQKIKPDEPNFWLQKGIVLRGLQRPDEANEFYQEAIAVYDEATATDKNNPLLWTDRGFVLLQLNRPNDAFASYDRALMLDDSFYEALMGKANTYIAIENYQQALATFDRAKEVRPQDDRVWHNRGDLLLKALNNPAEAATSFERATKLNPNFYPAWLGLGLALNTLQRPDEALSALDTAQQLYDRDPFLWINRGIVLESLGEFETALESYQKAIDLGFEPAKEPFKLLQDKL